MMTTLFHRFSARATTGRRPALTAAAMLTTLALAGCGGGNSSSDAARIRAVDVAVNAATANILVNAASANGDQMAFTDDAVSSYLYIAGDRTSAFSYTTTAAIPAGAAPPAGPSLSLSNNKFYTAFLIGRSDVPVRSTGYTGTTDVRFLQVVVTDDNHSAPASGNASVRVVDAAPDGGAVDVKVNGAALSSAYTGLSYLATTKTFLAAPYVDVPAGTLTVQVNKTGTATALFPSVSVPVGAGQSYTLIITEPTTTPTFGLQTVAD